MSRRELTPEQQAEKIAKAKATRDSYLTYEEGRICLEEYNMGWKLYLNKSTPMFFANLYEALTSRKVREFLVLRGNDEEKAFVANLVKQIS